MEQNKIYLGDSYELIKQIPDNSIDLIYTDPPYEFTGTVMGRGMFSARGALDIKDNSSESSALRTGHQRPRKQPYQDIQGNDKLTKGITNDILTEFVRVMKTINIYLWCNKIQIPQYLNFFLSHDCHFEILTWHKTNPTPMTHNTFLPDTEYCLYFRSKGTRLNDGHKLKSKFHISTTNKDDKHNFKHPTIKPLELVKRHILHSTQDGDIVLDPFVGSGTTAIAARELGRNYIGIEIDPKWHEVATDRLNNIDANGQTSFIAR